MNALIAQSVEHAAVNRGVTGSSPVWGAKTKPSELRVVFVLPFQIDFSLCHRNSADASAVNCFAGLRFLWKIQQAEKRKK